MPFAVVVILALGLAPLGDLDWKTGEFLWATVLMALVIVGATVASWKRNSLALNLIVLGSFIPIALLRDVEGGATSGYAPLAILPVLWLGLYGTRRFTFLAIVGATAMFLVPIAFIGGANYPLTEGLRNTLFWFAILSLLGVTIQHLRRDIRTQMSQISDQAGRLAQANLYLNQAFDHAPIGMTLSNLEGAFTRVNDAFCKMLGRARDEIVGRSFMEFTHPDDHDVDRKAFQQLVTGEISSYQSEKRFVNKDGTTISVLLNVASVLGQDGNLVEFFGQMQDITARKLAELELNRLADIVGASDDAILGCGLDGAITSWNNGAAKIFGYTDEEIIGKAIPSLVPGARSGEEVTVLKRVLAGEMVQGHETQGVDKNGKLIDLALTVSPIKDSSGQIVSISLTARDITEKNRVRGETERLRNEFISLVSHEFRTPLTSIIGYLELLQEGRELDVSDDRADEFLEVIKRNSERLMRLVNDLLFVSKVQSGGFVVEKGSVDLVDLISQSVKAAQPAAAHHGIELAFEIETETTVEGDSGRLSQLLDNLISNAVKYTPEGERVGVTLSQEDDFAVVSVSNSGAYIVPDELEHIFEPFFRASNAVSAELPGVGLGLLITKSIVEAHKGEITVESNRETGTTFEVRIPSGQVSKPAQAQA